MPDDFTKSRDRKFVDIYGNVLPFKDKDIDHNLYEHCLELLKQDRAWHCDYFKPRLGHQEDTVKMELFGHECEFEREYINDCFFKNLSVTLHTPFAFKGKNMVKVSFNRENSQKSHDMFVLIMPNKIKE